MNVTLTDADDDIVFYETKLQDIYPNPFNPSGAGRSPTTTISFSLTAKDAKNAKIEIFNLKGQKVKQLVNEQLPAGQHSVIWNGTDNNGTKISSGLYLVRMKSGKYTSLKKIILLR
jgi:flagellar hook assembly protein FlgD